MGCWWITLGSNTKKVTSSNFWGWRKNNKEYYQLYHQQLRNEDKSMDVKVFRVIELGTNQIGGGRYEALDVGTVK